ncbi:Transcriptional antiterminator of lichenan operon, BglG family [Streptococcus sp. DD10]|uniref:BglG family transcription antiterminator n=1 Tax=Streptococcus sp. DD10 TaxID=1777878 RepID=UPI00079141BD|nr:BglG family transcription antiterminator [Streptococcus sp. DD10]KXT73667.1 Transcriptional antiterminator of lichenan operon, BglG family [Streptococcus sp. DD10]
MFNIKEKRIIQCLLDRKGRFTSSKELAEQLSCSDRTVRNYLKNITQILEKEGVTLFSKQGQGYQLVFHQQRDYQNLVELVGYGVTTVQETEMEERYALILNKLLFEQEPILFDDLADELYVCRSTLSHDFKKIRQLLSEFHLEVESRANRGVYISGRERDKRRFITNYFLSNHFFKTLHQYVPHDFFDQTLPLGKLTTIVLEECRKAQLRLSDFVLQNLVVHIALSIKRLQDGFELAEVDWQLEDVESERRVAQRILSRIEEKSHLVFPRQEIDYITLHLIAKRQLTGKQYETISKTDIRQDLLRSLKELGVDEIYHFSSDFQFLEGVVTHLATLQVRLANQLELSNPLLAEIEEQYGDIFFLSKQVLQEMDFFTEAVLTDDEIAYVALHFMASIERQRDAKKFRVLAICATGIGAAQMLKNRLEAELGHRIEVVDVIGYYELDQKKLEGIDLLISAVDLSNLILPIPVFTVSVFLKTEEVDIIKKALNRMVTGTRMITEKKKESQEDLDVYFSEQHFQIYHSGDKEVVLENMVQDLLVGDEEIRRDDFLALLAEREAIGTVVFSERIAVPHPCEPLTRQAQVAVAICKEPLVWEEGREKIQLIFLLSPSIYNNEGFKVVTQKILAVTENEKIQEELVACEDFSTFLSLLKKI